MNSKNSTEATPYVTTVDSRRIIVEALQAARTDAIDHLAYLNGIIHTLEGERVIGRDDVQGILATPSFRAGSAGDRTGSEERVHARQHTQENRPATTGDFERPLYMVTSDTGRANPRSPQTIRKHAARRYGTAIATIRRVYPAEAADIEALVRALRDEAAAARVAAREARHD